MSGNHKHNSLESTLDKPCIGRCGSCVCSYDQCFRRLDNAVNTGANRDLCPGKDGLSDEAIPSLPINIAIDRFQAPRMAEDSFNENIIDPNQAPQPPGPSFALTHDNITSHTRSYNETGSYQEEWLRQERMRVDENPFAAFLSPEVETEMFDFEQEGIFGAMDIDGSMHVEESIAGDSRSVTSRSTCPRSRSTRSTGQLLAGMEPTPGFVFRPLPLLPHTLLPNVVEVTCENCGREHEYDGV